VVLKGSRAQDETAHEASHMIGLMRGIYVHGVLSSQAANGVRAV
jgi:hypothetical protein